MIVKIVKGTEKQMSAMSYGNSYSAMPRLRITRRGRVVVTLLVAIALAVAAVLVGIGAVGAAAGTEAGTTTFHYVSVAPGESLWQLAETIAPHSDPRDVIADIQNLNNLRSSDLQPGQQIAIPSKYAH